MSEPTNKPEAPKKANKPATKEPSQFVTKEEHERGMNSIMSAIADLSNSLTKPDKQPETAPSRPFSATQPSSPARESTTGDASAENSNFTLNRAYQNILEEYFDPADGFEGRLEGLNFTIIVPMSFSNASSAWKSYYKVDTRLKVLNANDINGSMRKWCELVARNLGYKKKGTR